MQRPCPRSAGARGCRAAGGRAYPALRQRRSVRAAGERLGPLRRDGRRALDGRYRGACGGRCGAESDRAGRRRDAQGAAEAGVRGARDAPVADPPAQHDGADRSRGRDPARMPFVLRRGAGRRDPLRYGRRPRRGAARRRCGAL